MNNENPNPHPAYQAILDVLPESLHSIIVPKLKEWDAGVTKKFQEIHAEYEPLKPFKKFVDAGIEPEYAEQAVMFADELQSNPQKVVDKLNESWDLGYVSKEQAQALQQAAAATNNNGEEFEYGDPEAGSTPKLDDLLKVPQFKEMYEGMQKIQNEWTQTRQQTEEEEQQAAFEEYLDSLEKQTTDANLPFNRVFVTALVSQGIDGEEAVKQYHQVLAVTPGTQITEQAPSNTPEAPVVMGGDGVAGSGTPDGSVNFGSLSKNDLNATVEQMIAQANQSGQ